MVKTDALALVALCRACARGVYGHTPPTESYAERVAMLLAGTCAAESGMRAVRQRGFDWETNEGAWGLWQTEWIAVRHSREYLARRPDVERRAAQWLYRFECADAWEAVAKASGGELLRMIAAWPKLACLMCRIDYLTTPEPVPSTLEQQAAYWKRHYNSLKGDGTVEHYIQAFQSLVLPVW